MNDEKEVGKHAFGGECIPQAGAIPMFQTFSVGIFQWEEKRNGTLRRGKVKVRVSGSTAAPEAVLSRAKEICAALDRGTYSGPKNVRVGAPTLGKAAK